MFRSLLICLGGLLLVANAHGQTQRSGGDGAARAMQQLQQATADKARLQQENESLKKELETAKSKLAALSVEQGKLQQRARELETGGTRRDAESRNNAQELERTRSQMQELVTRFRETVQNLKEVETDRNALKAEKEAHAATLERCVDKNAQLFLLGNEMLDQYGKFGVWTAVKSKEAFTTLTRTRLENLADEYRDRIEVLRIRDKTAGVAP